MRKSELAGITILAITLISLNVFKGGDGERSAPKRISPAAVSGTAPRADKPLVVEVETSADWTTGEGSFKSFDY